MPSTQSLDATISKAKEDYHSAIEYEFILSPVTDIGGFAYMSPAQGFAVNKNSDNIDWVLEFLNYFFTEENNIRFAQNENIIPNIKNAFSIISEQFAIPESQISHLGEVTFDYGFYNIIRDVLREISKGNNPKYMIENDDGTYSMYSLDYYMTQLKDKFAEVRQAG